MVPRVNPAEAAVEAAEVGDGGQGGVPGQDADPAQPEEGDESVLPAVSAAGIGQLAEAVEEGGGHGRLHDWGRPIPKLPTPPKINSYVAPARPPGARRSRPTPPRGAADERGA
jgi:hypothetical protein